jgi:beta-1,4-mannosyl-glycoprotein beta-1,4-N-acetylglucosaminyltransferase
MKVFDCFIFFNELELLEIRLNTLDKYVDYFVIVESKKTFSFKNKPLYYFDNRHLFEKFQDKIIHVVTDFEYQSDWGNEAHQRNCIKEGLIRMSANPGDIIILSDLDEIPNLEGFKFNNVGLEVYTFLHQYYYYYLNCKMSLTQYISKVFKVEHLEYRSVQEMRGFGPLVKVDKMGWHFSFIGDTDKIRQKIDSFAHQDMNLPEFTDEEKLKERIDNNKDLFDRNYDFETVEIDKSFPSYIVKNKNKYQHIIK